MIVADTDVLVDFLSGSGPGAERVARELERADLRVTAITRFELLCGARGDRQRRAVGDLLAALPTLPLDEAAADLAAEVRRGLEEEGMGIGMADSLIAGIVRQHDGVLLTRSRRHFERVRGLRLANLEG
jgi:tRNA(fMet)-specific endonuclease VapC